MYRNSARIHHRRGFTLIEVMLVIAIIGCLSTLCIPLFQRFAARARKAELANVLGKVELNFRNNYQTSGVYGTPPSGDGWSAQNPSSAPGTSAAWEPNAVGWQSYQFPPDGPLHLRYRYNISPDGKTLTLEATGNFIGIPNWKYTQTFQDGAAPIPPVEEPIAL
jgi:prepilin-type N-terminal cleavage/methylation domain-containing protein